MGRKEREEQVKEYIRKTKPVKVIETADLHERVNSQIVMTVLLEWGSSTDVKH